MDFLAAKWIWLYIGAFMMLAEIMAPGFVIFFFGLAAATIGLLLFILPSSFELSLAWQLALFSFFSILYLVTLRRYAKSVFMGDTDDSRALDTEYAGRFAKVTETIRPGVPGRVMLGDAEWAALSEEQLDPGIEVKVIGRENLTLKVRKVG